MFKRKLTVLLAIVLTLSISLASTAYMVALEDASKIGQAETKITPLPTPDVHNITSEKTLYFQDGITGKWYEKTKGKCVISWEDKTRNGFFHAKLVASDGIAIQNYEIRLVAVANSNDDFVEGIFDIKKNGATVASGIHGKLYGLNQPLGSYFKFYSDNSAWHMSAYITYRFDY